MKKTVILVIAAAAVLAVAYLVYYGARSENGIGGKAMVTGIPEKTAPDERTVSGSRYRQYDPDGFDSEKGKKRVLFFHAGWCPTCKAANSEFTENGGSIPDDVVLFRTDYDSETALKRKFGITYQHTFVLVDGEGSEIRKWNGGGIEELAKNAL